MKVSSLWAKIAAAGLALVALSLGTQVPQRFGVPSQAAIRAEANRAPGIPYRVAMREAALSWTTAVRIADDELVEARAALRAWDPAAPFDERQARRQFLRSDEGGYVWQALAAIRRAARLARTPAERTRAEEKRWRWELTLLSAIPGVETLVCTRRNHHPLRGYPAWVPKPRRRLLSRTDRDFNPGAQALASRQTLTNSSQVAGTLVNNRH
jgi:hypothetical protein